ncbi:MAG TPA: hypothetical protein ENI12_05960 [Nitrospirae bacterium]|nr:hypothetical protein [Nitrospirota bacterium]
MSGYKNNNRNAGTPLLRQEDSPGIETCNGCAVCTLSCPVWGQTHDILLTFCGRMRATQGGATVEDLKPSASACVLCGSCEPVCPFGMDTVARTIELKAEVAQLSGSESPRGARSNIVKRAEGKVLLANSHLREHKDLLGRILLMIGPGVSEHMDNGEDISTAMESGGTVSSARYERFLGLLARAGEIVTTDGLLYRLLLQSSLSARILGLGEAMISNAEITGMLNSDDLYVIDSRTYHADHERLVEMYDDLRKRSGCMINLDLHRVATPTGASRLKGAGVVDPVRQARWILEGRPAKRVIVERLEDIEPFRQVTDVPVVFVSELS